MKPQEIYEPWKESKRQVEVPENFANEVMDRIHQCGQKKGKSLFDIRPFVELIVGHPLARPAMVAAGALAGILRIVFVVCVFLRA